MPLNILYIVPYVPNLIRVRPFQLIKNLKQLGHQVTVLTLWTDEWEKNGMRSLQAITNRVIGFHLPKWESYLNCLLTIPTQQPLQTVYCYQPELEKKMMEILLDRIDGNIYDVVHIEHLRGARYGLSLRKHSLWGYERNRANVPIVWDSVDSISYLFQQAKKASKQSIRRMLYDIELRRTRRMEGTLVQYFDRVLVTSNIDRRAFLDLSPQTLDPDRIKVLSNGVDLEYFSPSPDSIREENSIVISGKMSYHANESMVLYMLEEIMPIVWAQKPKAKIYVVGKDPTNEIRAYKRHPRVEITGTVPDIRPYLQRASVSVSPVLYGAGIQNKILEAMACSTPVVSSWQAVNALHVQPGIDLLIANTAFEFAEMILDLFDHQEKRQSIGFAGRKYVENYHDWRNTAIELETIYLDVIKSFSNHYS
jgi:glycosyltransferase involved in cell wall biosynthesis